MLLDELKVELPGETIQPAEMAVKQDDMVGEEEYLRRTDGMTAEKSAGIALEISEERKLKEQEASSKETAPPEKE